MLILRGSTSKLFPTEVTATGFYKLFIKFGQFYTKSSLILSCSYRKTSVNVVSSTSERGGGCNIFLV